MTGEWIEESGAGYEAFYRAVYELVPTIPEGRVMTYGSVAAALGSRAPRAVGRIMSHSGDELPWWRVVYSDGHILPAYYAEAIEHYQAEGTPLLTGPGGPRLDLRRAKWSPASSSMRQ